MSALSTVLSTHIRRRRKFGEISCTECTGQWNSNSVNGTRNPIKGYFGSEFLAIYNHCRVMAAWSRKMLKICERGCKEVFGKTTLMEKFSKFCSKSFHHDTSTCWVKYGRQEISEIVRCLHDKQNFAWLCSCCYYADHAGPNNVLRVLQISSKSVHFQRSYSRTREHRQNVP